MIDFDGRKLTDQLTRLLTVCDSLPEIAQQVQAETLGYLFVSAGRNIYDTAAGAYRRTGDYLQGLDARARGTRNTISVTVLNSVDYAGYVESGQEGMSYAMLQQMAMLQSDPSAPLSLGRSGVNWTRAGPVVIGGQNFAAFRVQDLFAQKVRQAVR